MITSMACCQYPVRRLVNNCFKSGTFNVVVPPFQLGTGLRLLQRSSPHHNATSRAIRSTRIAKSFHATGGSLRAAQQVSAPRATSASTPSASIGVTNGGTALCSHVAQTSAARTVGTRASAWIASTAKSSALTSLALAITAATLCTTHGLSGSGGSAACSGFWGSGKDNNKDDDDNPVNRFNKAVKAFVDVAKSEKDFDDIFQQFRKRFVRKVMNDGTPHDDPFDRLSKAIAEGKRVIIKEGKDREVNLPAELSFGFVMGGCCGFAAKKTGKLVVLGVGFMFVGIQALSHLGFLKLDYAKLEAYFTDALDVNRDGKVDGRDLRTLFDRAVKAGAFGLPAGSGFAIGAIVGFRYG